jgi:predicted RNase H-like HicB family nuclease
MRYLVKIYRSGGNYSAEVPDLPGCVAAGRTVEKTRKRIAEAITLHLEAMRRAGENIPAPTQQIEFAIDPAGDEEFCTWVDVEEEPVSA